MSGRGGRRVGSGRKKIHASKAEGSRFWQMGKTRVWIDNNLYLAWISARTECGYTNDSSFIAHLLALERRRRAEEEERKLMSKKRKRIKDVPPSKHRRHFEGPLSTSTSKVMPPEIAQSPSESVDLSREVEVDITGVTEMSVNNSSYMIQNNSVVLQDDQSKYACSEEDSDAAGSDSDSESDSDESGSTIPSRWQGAVENALQDRDEDLDEDGSERNDSDLSESKPRTKTPRIHPDPTVFQRSRKRGLQQCLVMRAQTDNN